MSAGILAWATPGTVSLVGAILVAIGTYWAFSQQGARSAELARLANENAALSKQLTAKSDEIAALAKDSLAAVTGGDSFVYLEPLRKAGRVRYFLRQTGQQPTYDVVVRVQEIFRGVAGNQMRQLLFGPSEVGRTLKRGSGFDWTYPDPTPPDNRQWPLMFQEPPPQAATAREFRVELAARNGIVVQWLRVTPVGDRWHTTSKHVERAGGQALEVHPDFKEAQEQAAQPPGEVDE